ncbi:MAG: hypothetical protein K2K17_03565, partial [Lachnospiraceae bacterium]|nr:hypothetical protein [Lachnospiraceae bacterium]
LYDWFIERHGHHMKTSPLSKILAVLGFFLLGIYIAVLVFLLYKYTTNPNSTRTSSLMIKEEYREPSIHSILAGNSDDSSIYTAHGSSLNTQDSSTLDKNYRDPLVTLKGNGEDQVTVLIYLNGSNLETDYGCATTDIKEMLNADLNDKVSVLIQTMGTLEWQDYDIASDHTQRYLIEDHDLVLVDDSLGQEDCTDPKTLSDFINWSEKNYPADRYILILWNHGGGSVEGFGYNQWGRYSDSLTLDEMQTALKDGGVSFDFIGMDSCIMSSIEICYALYDYCDYMILSEDFESSLGWYYKGWLSKLADNTSIDTVSLAKIIIDDMVEANEKNHLQGMSSTLALIDQKYVPVLFDEWKNFAYANTEELLACNYSREVVRSGRPLSIRRKHSLLMKVDSEMQEYYITDMLAVVASINSAYSKSMTIHLNNAIAYYNYTDNNSGLTGLSVTLPYGDRSFYRDQVKIYQLCGFDKEYIEWLEQFTSVTGEPESYEDNNYDVNIDDEGGFIGGSGLW